MDTFVLLSGFSDTILGYLLPFLFVLTVVVFFHELGHFLVARWCGVAVKTFSIGFGPEIAGFTDRHGTRWRLSWIPLGGYVKFIDDENAASAGQKALEHLTPEEREQSFQAKPLGQRAAVVAAGPIANFILAIAIFAVLFSVYGRQVADPVVARVNENSAAAQAGVIPGDRLISIGGTPVTTFDDVRRYVSVRPELKITIRIERNGAMLDLPMVPQRTELADQFGNKMEIGIIGILTDQEAGNFRTVTYGPIEAVGQGVLQSWHVITGTFDYLGNVLTGRMKADQIGGPIRVAKVSGQMATLGIPFLLNIAAILSVSIGLLNLMPVPVLDGGHLMFYAVEALRGKPVGPAAQDVAYRIGFAMVLMLMVFATWNDISMFFG